MSIISKQQQVREFLIKNLRRDLLGPGAPEEQIIQNRGTGEGDTPISRYLLGILYPSGTPVAGEDDDAANEGGDDPEESAPEGPVHITGVPKPSSIALSFAVAHDVEEVEVVFCYGLYTSTELTQSSTQNDGSGVENITDSSKTSLLWQRTPVNKPFSIALPDPAAISNPRTNHVTLPEGGQGEWLIRPDKDCFVISVFLRNTNQAEEGPDDPGKCLFQPEIQVCGKNGTAPILNRANRMSQTHHDPDLESYRLLYRHKAEFAVGHGCAADWDDNDCPPDRARMVRTELLPAYEVTPIEASGAVNTANLSMDLLAKAQNGEEIRQALQPLTDNYKTWIKEKRHEIRDLPSDLKDRANAHLDECQQALNRIREGLDLIRNNALVFEAFRFANHAMMLQRRKSVETLNFKRGKGRIFDESAPTWRPFQIAFILLNLKGIAVPESEDRQIADLLWFPTGGGKTESYLGLAAFTMALRRLKQTVSPRQGESGDGGVTVLMRYTLRLLTIQQFQRAATLICACELLRRKNPERFGHETFSIGLWVGGAATPNEIDRKPDPRYGSFSPGALQVLENFDSDNEPAEGNPVQLRSCPWCGEALSHENYRVIRELSHLQIRCPNGSCDFHGDENDEMSGLPAYVVDEEVYFRCPTLLIGTVDKFARLPWKEETKALFGRVDRYCERHGFIPEGVSHPNTHNSVPKQSLPATGPLKKVCPFLPPELIIQDELHLITGPLGSLVGLYESAIDFLCTWSGSRPKVIASTATIRRYRDQIKGIFNRESRQFPPPGLRAGDSFFAAENKERPGRKYLGIFAAGRSLKTAAVRILASILHSTEQARQQWDDEVVDPYWTLVYYFNSLRELGGALRLIDDDVHQRLKYLANIDNIDNPRQPERRPELTSRVAAKEISNLLRQMEQALATGDALDVVLATNMISVGVDIQRFGLMLVTGQPKNSAEYIQATSRVGRQAPGLVLTLYNWSRPRDLSHYERFTPYHSMLYRNVEASSVTPFSPRSVQKGLHAVMISILRLLDVRLSENSGAQNFDPNASLVKAFREDILQRVKNIDPAEVNNVYQQLQSFIDGWVEMQAKHGTDLKYHDLRPGDRDSKPWLIQSAEEGQDGVFPKPTLNSLRDVEKESGLYFKFF